MEEINSTEKFNVKEEFLDDIKWLGGVIKMLFKSFSRFLGTVATIVSLFWFSDYATGEITHGRIKPLFIVWDKIKTCYSKINPPTPLESLVVVKEPVPQQLIIATPPSNIDSTKAAVTQQQQNSTDTLASAVSADTTASVSNEENPRVTEGFTYLEPRKKRKKSIPITGLLARNRVVYRLPIVIQSFRRARHYCSCVTLETPAYSNEEQFNVVDTRVIKITDY